MGFKHFDFDSEYGHCHLEEGINVRQNFVLWIKVKTMAPCCLLNTQKNNLDMHMYPYNTRYLTYLGILLTIVTFVFHVSGVSC